MNGKRKEKWSDTVAIELMKNFARMQDSLLARLAGRLETLEKMSPDEIQKYARDIAMSEAIGEDLAYIKREISKQNRVYSFRIASIFDIATDEIFKGSEKYFDYRKIKIEKIMKRSDTVNLIKKAQNETVSSLLNLSHTYCYDVGGEVSEIGKAYRKIVNKAILEVASGQNPDRVIKRAVEHLANSGIKTLQWGKENSKAVVRRADSHVRMNVEEGLSRLNQSLGEHNAKIFGADGVQVSMHALCAPDHQDIQGQQFTLKEWESINGGLTRPIGTLNCKHWISYCIMDISQPIYSKSEIAEAKMRSNAIVEYNGKKMTRYDASQKMRAYERSIRGARSAEQAFRKSGKENLADNVQSKIDIQIQNYKDFCSKVGLTPRIDRTKYVI